MNVYEKLVFEMLDRILIGKDECVYEDNIEVYFKDNYNIKVLYDSGNGVIINNDVISRYICLNALVYNVKTDIPIIITISDLNIKLNKIPYSFMLIFKDCIFYSYWD